MRTKAELNILITATKPRIIALLQSKGAMKPVDIFNDLVIDGSLGRICLEQMKGAGVLASTGRYYLIPEPTQSIQVQPLPDRALALVQVKNGSLVTDSLMVAEVFEKEHFNVLESIKSLECSSNFRELNFKASNYLNNQGKNFPCVEMTRDGFTFLAMGFTGSKAAAWKEKYIAAFNAMEKTLKTGSSILEQNLIVLTDLQRAMQESVNNGFGMMNTRMISVESKVDNLNHKVTDLDREVMRFTTSKRRNIKGSVKSLITKHTKKLGGKCPCCGISDVVNDEGMIIKGCEFDHFYQNSIPYADSVWLICGQCHKELTHGKTIRKDRVVEFGAFQSKRMRLPEEQMPISWTE